MTERLPGRDHDERPGIRVIFQPAVHQEPGAEPQVDPGFKTAWSSKNTEHQTSYSLVEVPIGEPFEIVYSKPQEELGFTMSPTKDHHLWNLRGEIDSDIVQLLGMPVESKRQDKIAPVIGERNIEKLREFGDVDASDDQILAVDLTVSTQNIANLLVALWRPRHVPGENRPKISLDNNGKGVRILPEKINPSGKGGASIKVRKPQPVRSS